jgi:uncharacterized membrane protein YfcA
MEYIILAGYSAAVLIGMSLGLIGGGGSILTVPVLVYILGVDPVLATAYSLFVVGTTSLVGAGTFMKKRLVNYHAAIVFAIPSFITVFLTRKFLMPWLPDPLFQIPTILISKSVGIMVFFALLMLAASVSMIRTRKSVTMETEEQLKFNFPMIALEGSAVGLITGVVGAGGGFLIIPALVLLARLPMKMAVGTSLLIISAKSLIGFLGDVSTQAIDWQLLFTFTGLSVMGIFIGSALSKKIREEALKSGFGWFVLVMGFSIMVRELMTLRAGQ